MADDSQLEMGRRIFARHAGFLPPLLVSRAPFPRFPILESIQRRWAQSRLMPDLWSAPVFTQRWLPHGRETILRSPSLRYFPAGAAAGSENASPQGPVVSGGNPPPDVNEGGVGIAGEQHSAGSGSVMARASEETSQEQGALLHRKDAGDANDRPLSPAPQKPESAAGRVEAPPASPEIAQPSDVGPTAAQQPTAPIRRARAIVQRQPPGSGTARRGESRTYEVKPAGEVKQASEVRQGREIKRAGELGPGRGSPQSDGKTTVGQKAAGEAPTNEISAPGGRRETSEAAGTASERMNDTVHVTPREEPPRAAPAPVEHANPPGPAPASSGPGSIVQRVSEPSGSPGTGGTTSVKVGLDAADASARPTPSLTQGGARSQPDAPPLTGTHCTPATDSDKGDASTEHAPTLTEPQQAAQIQPSPLLAQEHSSPLDHPPLTTHLQLRPKEDPGSQGPGRESLITEGPAHIPDSPSLVLRKQADGAPAETVDFSGSGGSPRELRANPAPKEQTSGASTLSPGPEPAGIAEIGAGISSQAAPEIVHRQTTEANSAREETGPGVPLASSSRESAEGGLQPPYREPYPGKTGFSLAPASGTEVPRGLKSALHQTSSMELVSGAHGHAEGLHAGIIHKTIGSSESHSTGNEVSPAPALSTGQRGVGKPEDASGASALALRAASDEAPEVLQRSAERSAVHTGIVPPEDPRGTPHESDTAVELIHRQSVAEAVQRETSRRGVESVTDATTQHPAPDSAVLISRQQNIQRAGTDPHPRSSGPGSIDVAETSILAPQLDRGSLPDASITLADEPTMAQSPVLHHVAGTISRQPSVAGVEAAGTSGAEQIAATPANEPTAQPQVLHRPAGAISREPAGTNGPDRIAATPANEPTAQPPVLHHLAGAISREATGTNEADRIAATRTHEPTAQPPVLHHLTGTISREAAGTSEADQIAATPANEPTAQPLVLHHLAGAISLEPSVESPEAAVTSGVDRIPSNEPPAQPPALHHLAGVISRKAASASAEHIAATPANEPAAQPPLLQHLAATISRQLGVEATGANEADRIAATPKNEPPVQPPALHHLAGAISRQPNADTPATSGTDLRAPDAIVHAPDQPPAVIAHTVRANGAVPGPGFSRITHLNPSQISLGGVPGTSVSRGTVYRFPADGAPSVPAAPIAAPTASATPPGAVPGGTNSGLAARMSELELRRLADKIYALLLRRLTSERDRRGIGNAN